MDQPAKITEIFRIIENLEAERQNDQERKKKWQKVPSKSNSRLTSKKR